MKTSKKLDIKRVMNYLKIQKEDFKLLLNILLYIIISLAFFLEIEWLQRGRVGVLSFINTYKSSALLNYSILLLVISPSILVKRTHFLAVLLGLPWLVLAVISAMLVKFRGVPFTWADIYSAGEGVSIANQYISKEIIIQGWLAGFITLLFLVICFFISFRNYEVRFIKRVIVLAAILVVTLMQRDYLIKHGAAEKTQGDMTYAYNRNGFMYSFTQSYLDTFRRETDGYSYKAIKEEIITVETESSIKPNIIMVQVEAFCDPTIIKGAKFEEDPIPNFRKYFNKNYSGQLQVPTIGGATARTEFEVLTGVNLDYLSPGEIPYNSGLTSKEPIETIAYILKGKGYRTTAIHNFQGNFYNRDKAFQNLGFERFIPMECMIGLVKYRAFPEDHVLLDYIKRVLNATEKEDFIFTITAGTHGPYSTVLNLNNQKYVSGSLKKSTLYQLQNYTSLIRRTDKFIGELAEYVYTLSEPTVLIVYSDHNPKLEAIDSLGEEQKFKTPYFIIHNQNKLPKSGGNDIEAYQLSADIFNLNMLKGGIINTFHAKHRNKKNYQTRLELLQYDMLFGEKYAMNNQNPYTSTLIQLGLEKIEVIDAQYTDSSLVVEGNGFTESSKIFLDDKLIETEFVDGHKLIGKHVKDTSNAVQVKLLGRYDAPLLSSNTIFFKIY